MRHMYSLVCHVLTCMSYVLLACMSYVLACMYVLCVLTCMYALYVLTCIHTHLYVCTRLCAHACYQRMCTRVLPESRACKVYT